MKTMNSDEQILAVRELTVEYPQGRGRDPLRAVDKVTFDIAQGETLGLVGESGSGKSTIGRAILGLVSPTAGSIEFGGQDITRAGSRERRALSQDLQVIFQDPYSSLNPSRTIGATLAESLRLHPELSKDQVRDRAADVLGRVGLPRTAIDRFPSNFSGGQRQRIAIARALMVEPRLVICDEPVSALDLSVQAQVLNLLSELQREFNLGYLFVAHDLDVVRHLSHRIIVLFGGQVMEEGPAEAVYSKPLHPYTKALLDAAPVPDPVLQAARRTRREQLPIVSGARQSAGCPFATRCPHALPVCHSERPTMELTPVGTSVACHRWRDLNSVPTLELPDRKISHAR